jgi:hypothetical protein
MKAPAIAGAFLWPRLVAKGIHVPQRLDSYDQESPENADL